jgi:hypothetical protein
MNIGPRLNLHIALQPEKVVPSIVAHLYLRKTWKHNLDASYIKITKHKFKEHQRVSKILRPIQVVLGQCYHLNQKAVTPFYETVLDKTILIGLSQ